MLAEVLDTSGIELQAKVNEADRANLNVGQTARVSVNGLATAPFPATIKTIAGVAGRNFFEIDSRRKFDTTLQLAQADQRLRPGVSADVVISGQQFAGALYIPRQALFEKDGKAVVYARGGDGFQPKPVKVKVRSESRAVIEGLAEGTEVALVNPEVQEKTGAGPKAPATPAPAAQGGRR
jgi:HlyD family secretion protein